MDTELRVRIKIINYSKLGGQQYTAKIYGDLNSLIRILARNSVFFYICKKELQPFAFLTRYQKFLLSHFPVHRINLVI